MASDIFRFPACTLPNDFMHGRGRALGWVGGDGGVGGGGGGGRSSHLEQFLPAHEHRSGAAGGNVGQRSLGFGVHLAHDALDAVILRINVAEPEGDGQRIALCHGCGQWLEPDVVRLYHQQPRRLTQGHHINQGLRLWSPGVR